MRRTTAKSYGATGHIRDVFGAWWDISELRGTAHGFDIALGRPVGVKRGVGGCGASRVVLTAPLARFLEEIRMHPGKAHLPIERKVIQRLRKRLGHHIRRDTRTWWEERKDDLARLSGAEFAAKHGKTPQAANYNHRMLIGKQLKPRLWWRSTQVQALLFSGKPDAEIALVLDVRPNRLPGLRTMSRKAGLVKHKRGEPYPLGPRIRPRDWWKAPEVQELLKSARTDGEIAAALGIGRSWVNILRSRSGHGRAHRAGD